MSKPAATPLPPDPMVRLRLLLRRMRRQKRLVAAIVIAALMSASAWAWMFSAPEQPWTPSEMKDMSGLPLSPGGAQPLEGPTAEDEKTFLELQRQLNQQPVPDPNDNRGS